MSRKKKTVNNICSDSKECEQMFNSLLLNFDIYKSMLELYGIPSENFLNPQPSLLYAVVTAVADRKKKFPVLFHHFPSESLLSYESFLADKAMCVKYLEEK